MAQDAEAQPMFRHDQVWRQSLARPRCAFAPIVSKRSTASPRSPTLLRQAPVEAIVWIFGGFMATCSVCGRPAGFKDICARCEAKGLAPAVSDPDVAESAPDSIPPTRVLSHSAVIRRYRDSYRVAAALILLGNTIKIVGGTLATIIVVGSLASAGDRFGGAVGGIFIAVIVGVLFWVCGVMVAAQGQILLATLDNAVANSPFLTNSERAEAMGLPSNVADRGTAG